MAVKMFTTIAVTSLLRDYDDHYDCDSDRVYGCKNGSNRNDTCDCKSQGAKLWMLQNSKKVGHIFYATLVTYACIHPTGGKVFAPKQVYKQLNNL